MESTGTTARRGRVLKGLAVYGAVGALVVAAALPAYGALTGSPGVPSNHVRTIQQVASADAQNLQVAADVVPVPLVRGSYAATTIDEIAHAKAAAAAAAAAAAQKQASVADRAVPLGIDLNMHAPGDGAIRWPLAHVTRISDGFGARNGRHKGVDLLDPARTPIFAAMSGVVRASTESYSTYGVAVLIDSRVDGRLVTTLYAHMTNGTRVVQTGQTVEAGQLIGLVGMTGLATANHLHFEVHLDGTPVDPLAWLLTNVGPVP
jgi:murein DD-endopeptidase MepM/ murein hydrolase activator NlpD